MNTVYTIPSITLNTPRRLIGSVYTLWAGDANYNKNIKYNGLQNDKDQLLNSLGGINQINSVLNGYRSEDLNMDGKLMYNNINNDRLTILNTLGISSPNNIFKQHTPN